MTTPTFSLNPHRRPAVGEEVPGAPSTRVLVLAIAGIWAAALVLAAVGLRVRTGAWPASADEAVFLPLTAGLLALPVSLVRTWGVFIGPAVFPLAFAFWPLVLGLQVAAVYRRRWRYLLPVVALVLAAGWNWITASHELMSV